MFYEVAPLQGITTAVFRSTHCRMFGGADTYYTPFFSPTKEHFMTTKERRDLDPEQNQGISVIPQIMTRKAEDFLWAAGELKTMGYREVNLNLGCPSRTVTAKGKGAGFLAYPEELDHFFETVFSAVPAVSITVKTRLGMRDPEEFTQLLEIYNRYPIEKLIIHPRIQKDFYQNKVRMDFFRMALETSCHPICYNGDLVTVADCTDFFQKFPTVHTVMIGRGAIADPALFRKLRGGACVRREELQLFTDTLYQAYQQAYGSRGPAVQRMKELWFYLLHLFADSEKYEKKMRRISAPNEYERLEEDIYRDLSLRRGAAGPF